MSHSLWTPELPPWEVAFRAGFIYVFVQVVFRLAGRKELGRWGISDVVLLFLIGTSVRQSIVATDTSLTSAMIGLSTIAFLDWGFSLATARSRALADLLEGRVRPLVKGGTLDREEMRRRRISEDELLAQVRSGGHGSLAEVEEAYLERSGKVTIVWRRAGGAGPAGR